MNSFEQLLFNYSCEPLYVINAFNYKKYTPLDLAESNKELLDFDITSAEEFENYINSLLDKKQASVAFGGYNETRKIYQRSNHFFETDYKKERNIHLGMDFWCSANTPVLVPLEGKVHSFKNNTAFGDYGPTIILEHVIEGVIFYTLYGHLSLESISNLTIGQEFKKGEELAYLGDASVNGDYAPHLHFQIIKDLEGSFGDYKGVTSLNEQKRDLNNCPDPNLLLKVY
ncbi:peptidoglycan DD-metalloendopeptidase family protein [Pseudofulvibacter geojedonensis]|uniref:Peptidoglycan DD-metalloendopeptidase family protein n=1 Tax=Pseudofulvibacter geojedonensis TaxID=1123758 RepID=A0ABW3HZ63_9FLAO